jgi:hypothetical protein
LKINAGTKTTRDSRSQRPSSLEPALQPGARQAASAATRLQSEQESTGFSR